MENGFDADLRLTNITPIVYNNIIFNDGVQEKFLKELSDLYNRYGLDSRLNIRDVLLAEMTFNFLAVVNNTIDKACEMSF